MIIEKKSIPKDWDIISVEDCFDILDNQRKPINESERNLMKGDIPYYGANGIVDFVNEYLFDDDLILIAEDGGYFDEFQTRPIAYRVNGKAWINNHAHVLKAKNGYYQDYLFYCLEHKNILIWLNGGTRAKLNKGDLEKLPIQIAPLPEQKAIAQVLSTADAAIQTTEKLIAQKELRKKWLMQQLLTGKKRLKGFSEEWKKERLEKYLVKHDEKTTTNNQYPVLTSSRKGIFLQSDYYTRDVASEDNTGYNVVPRGYFTYRHMSDDLIFKFNINDIVDKGIVSTLYPVFTTKGINDYFLLAKLNEGNEFKMHAGEQKQGGSRTYVYFNTLCQLKLNMPSIEEQTAIAQVLQAADKEISLLKAKAEKLWEQKKGLMQVLLTGKVRLKINNE